MRLKFSAMNLKKLALWVNPKFCVKSILGENRAMFIWGGSKGNQLPPFQEHSADGADVKGDDICLFTQFYSAPLGEQRRSRIV